MHDAMRGRVSVPTFGRSETRMGRVYVHDGNNTDRQRAAAGIVC